jgi:hypothetical protein
VLVLWRKARAEFDRSERSTDSGAKKEFLLTARRLAEEAVAMAPSNSDGHKWLAISAGAMAEFETLKGKLDCGHRFKHHITTAISLRPDEPTAHHLFGRWCLEVSL